MISGLNGGTFSLTQEGEDLFAPNIESSNVTCRFIEIISDNPVWGGYTNLRVKIAIDGRITTATGGFPELDYPSNNTIRTTPELYNGASIENVGEGVIVDSSALEYRATLLLSREQIKDLLNFYYNQRHAIFSYPLTYNIFDSASPTLPTTLQIVDIKNISRKSKTRWTCAIVFQGG